MMKNIKDIESKNINVIEYLGSLTILMTMIEIFIIGLIGNNLVLFFLLTGILLITFLGEKLILGKLFNWRVLSVTGIICLEVPVVYSIFEGTLTTSLGLVYLIFGVIGIISSMILRQFNNNN